MVCLELQFVDSYKHHPHTALQTVAYDKRAAQINYFLQFYNLTSPIEFADRYQLNSFLWFMFFL